MQELTHGSVAPAYLHGLWMCLCSDLSSNVRSFFQV